jgi:hypothetical protein
MKGKVMQRSFDFVQRWRDRRDSYRPAGETINTLAYEVAAISGKGSDTIARSFVEQHHYSASYPAARFRFGLYRSSALVGAAVFSVPCRKEVISVPLGVPFDEGTDLGRFVLLDDVPANGETWFLARCFDELRKIGLAGVVSMSDPFPRTTADGTVQFGGHAGTIYQGLNGVYLGRATSRTLHLLPDGSVFSDRAAAKIRSQERGHEYAAAQLVAAGARPMRISEDPRAWLREVLEPLTRKVRHPGNFRYAWGFSKAVKKRLVPAGPYPKLIARPT